MYCAGINSEGFDRVKGPGDGLGYHAHTLNPHLTCRDEEEAERAANIANIAYKAGYKKAQHDIQTSLGLKT